jgi:peptide chain release factor 1
MDEQILRKVKSLQAKYDDLTRQVSDPNAQANATAYRTNLKAISDLQEVVDRYADYQRVAADLAGNRELLASGDPELSALAQEEIGPLEARDAALTDEIRALLLPKDPNDDRNVMLEIRAGTGGD